MKVGYREKLLVRILDADDWMCYESAEDIISLFEGNRQRQIQDGAPSEKTHIIPNGITVPRYEPLRARRPADTPHVAAFIGRVVSIKDVKTFIRALFTAS